MHPAKDPEGQSDPSTFISSNSDHAHIRAQRQRDAKCKFSPDVISGVTRCGAKPEPSAWHRAVSTTL